MTKRKHPYPPDYIIGGSHNWGYQKIDNGRILVKWMIWGDPYLCKPPYNWVCKKVKVYIYILTFISHGV